MEFFLILLAYGVICGAFCSFIANSKGRDGSGWFWLGLLFGVFALVAVAAVPPVAKTDPAATGQPYGDRPEAQQDAQKVELPEADLSSDGYRLWLADTYEIKRNDVFEQFVLGQKLFPTLGAALEHADELERKRRQENDVEARAENERLAQIEAQREIEAQELAEWRLKADEESKKNSRIIMAVFVPVFLLLLGAIMYFNLKDVRETQSLQAQAEATTRGEIEAILSDYGLSLYPDATSPSVTFDSNNCEMTNSEGSTKITFGVSEVGFSEFYQKEADSAGYRVDEVGQFVRKDGRKLTLILPEDGTSQFGICLEGGSPSVQKGA